ncbi:27861_t:CDS:2 [Racocetra persica]|uniref:27861_t:CDS:1 n=1 Tax=Racocetra persica TaxID=160502 RepID=A0ACA9LDV6_9GLOM|nr:27861_t:CDS:2 [Racocetra persica]
MSFYNKDNTKVSTHGMFDQHNSNNNMVQTSRYIRILEANLAKDSNQDSMKDSQQLIKIMLTNDE